MKIKAFVLSVLVVSQLFAHRVLMMIDDNADGTVTIETGLSSGGNAGGAKLYITDRASGRPLWQGVVPENGVVTAKRPNVAYSVTLSMSEGHAVTQPGPELLPLVEKTDSNVVVIDSSKITRDSTVTK